MPRKSPPGERTTITLSISVDDKRLMKQIALDRNQTASALLHDWIEREARQAGEEESCQQ